MRDTARPRHFDARPAEVRSPCRREREVTPHYLSAGSHVCAFDARRRIAFARWARWRRRAVFAQLNPCLPRVRVVEFREFQAAGRLIA